MAKLTEHPLSGSREISSPVTAPSGGAVEERANYLSLRRVTLKKYGLTPDDRDSLRAAIAYLDRSAPIPAGQCAVNSTFEREVR